MSTRVESAAPTAYLSCPQSLNELASRIYDLAKSTFKALVYSSFLYYHSYLFISGFFTAVFFTEAHERLDRINDLWNQTIEKQVALALLHLITAPIAYAVLSFWGGGQVASYFMNHSLSSSPSGETS